MIVSWFAFALLTGSLLTLSAIAAERLIAIGGQARRFVWLVTMILTACWPLISPLSLLLRRFAAPAMASSQLLSVRRISAFVVAPPAWEISSRSMLALLLLWALCSVVLLARIVVAASYARRHKRSWRETFIDGVRVHVAPDIGPAVVGLHDVHIILPEWVLETNPEVRALVLRHELEHRQARDPYALLFANIITALIPWNPALWFQARRLRLAIEMDCDTRVLRAFPAWREYARLLLAMSQQRSPASSQLAPALFENPSNLERRIVAMRRTRVSPPTVVLLTACTLLALIVACAVDRPESPRQSELSQQAAGPTKSVNAERPKKVKGTYFEFQVEKPATPIGTQTLAYPAGVRGVGGDVIAQYVVDQNGLVEMSSFKVLRPADPRLISAVKAALANWHYQPASVGGRPVKQLVQQEFQFGK